MREIVCIKERRERQRETERDRERQREGEREQDTKREFGEKDKLLIHSQ